MSPAWRARDGALELGDVLDVDDRARRAASSRSGWHAPAAASAAAPASRADGDRDARRAALDSRRRLDLVLALPELENQQDLQQVAAIGDAARASRASDRCERRRGDERLHAGRRREQLGFDASRAASCASSRRSCGSADSRARSAA